jgi:hypothetical protein
MMFHLLPQRKDFDLIENYILKQIDFSQLKQGMRH